MTATLTQDAACPGGVYWDIQAWRGGKLTATLAGTQHPLVIIADDEHELRTQIKTMIQLAML